MQRRSLTYLLLAASLALVPRVAPAAVFVPMTIDDLADTSFAVVAGEVARIDVDTDEASAIRTVITLQVLATLRGTNPGPVITVEEPGGSLGDVTEYVSGAARFDLGEEVLVFLRKERNGTLRINQGALGKFRLAQTAHGLELRRRFGADTTFLLSSGVDVPPASISWDQLTRALATATATPPSLRATASIAPRVSHRVLGGRFFEPDDGITIDFRLSGGDPTLGFVASRDAVEAAMAAWTDVDEATITMRYAGLIPDPGRACPGPNKIVFDDPEGIIAPPMVNPDGNDFGACRGELARGIQRTTRFETKSFNGIEVERVSCGFLVVADGWGACDVWTPCNVAEIATHELGHVLGLGHSSEDPNEANDALRDATMYYRAHFDGRCAGLRQDDIDGVRFVYPAALPPTITTTTPLPNGLPGVSYSRELQATGGSGDFVWSIAGGGFPGIDITPDGTLTGTPDANGTSFFQIRATDSNGDSHLKVLSFTAGTPGPAPPTWTPTATVSPTPTDTPASTPSFTLTPASTPTVEPGCPGDCDGSGIATVDEILVLVNVALGALQPGACPAGDLDSSNSVTVDEILQAVNAALQGCP